MALTLDYLGGHPSLPKPGGATVTRIGDEVRIEVVRLRGDGPAVNIPVEGVARVEVMEEGSRLVQKGRSGVGGALVGAAVLGPVGAIAGGLARRRAPVHASDRIMVVTVSTDGREYTLRFKHHPVESGSFDSVYARLVALCAPTYDASSEPTPLPAWVVASLAGVVLVLLTIAAKAC